MPSPSDPNLQIYPGTVGLKHNGSGSDIRGYGWSNEPLTQTPRKEYYALHSTYAPPSSTNNVLFDKVPSTVSTPTQFWDFCDGKFGAGTYTKWECTCVKL